MRRFLLIAAVLAQASLMSGCAAAWQSVNYSDDLYAIHNKIAIANRQKAEAELAKAQYEAQQAEYEAALAKIKAEAAKKGITVTEESSFNPYDAVLADSYESAYARRLYGFSSPTYRLPSSYYDWRYSDAFHYASAYDPAFYNIMVSGDMVWVEPKYVTSMFGSWGAVAVPSYSWYYGWGAPYRYYWNNPYRYSLHWNLYYDWYSPYYCGWGCYYPYHHHHHYHPSHYYPHRRPSHHRPSQRPPHAGSGSVGSTGHHRYRPGVTPGRNPGAVTPADRGSSKRPSLNLSKPATNAVRATKPTYRTSVSSSSYGKGSSTYRSSSSSNSSSSYRSSSSSSSSSSYRSSSPSSSSFHSSSSSSSSGGGYRSSSSSGGNSRGR